MKNIDFRNSQPLIIMVSQYDYGYNLQVALWTNGEPVTIAAAKIVSENFTVACTFSGNVVTIPVTTSMTEQFGHFPAELRVTDSTGQISSKTFDWFVERSPLAVKSTETYSGDIVEFTAKRVPLSSVVVTMEPIQDLNGYSSPWPAGGGKNKLPNTAVSKTENGITFTVNADGSVTVNGTATAQTNLVWPTFSLDGEYILSGCPSGGGASKYYLAARIRTSWPAGARDVGSGVTISGNITDIAITIVSGQTLSNAIFKPMLRLATDTDPTYAPYSNICPISGRTGASVVVSGKNLADDGFTWNINASGVIENSSLYNSSIVGVKKDEQYVQSINGALANIGVIAFYTDYPAVGSQSYDSSRIVNPGSPVFTAPIDGYAVIRNASSATNIQIERGSTATEYEPYQSTTYPITFTSAGTVYAGTVDLVSGRLEVTHGGYTFTGDETFGMNGGNTNIIYFNGNSLANPMKSGTWNDDENTLCSSFEKVMSNADFGIRFGANSKYIYFYQILNTLGIASIADWKTWLASNNVQITYPLETPLTYNLTPTQVMSLLGENIVWSPDGEIEVVVPEYY